MSDGGRGGRRLGMMVSAAVVVLIGGAACAGTTRDAERTQSDTRSADAPGDKEQEFTTKEPPTEEQNHAKLEWLAGHPSPEVDGADEDGPPGRPEVGIFSEAHESYWSPTQYRVEDQWQDVDGDVLLRVFAGAYGSAGLEPDTGVIVVASVNWTTGEFLWTKEVAAPVGTASLHIMSADGHHLTLETDKGETFTFDADTLELSEE
jgi:hypothetical protein